MLYEAHDDSPRPMIMQAEPVLTVNDISKTVNYWHDVLGFPQKWTWGDPPNHGGVAWHGGANVQFSLDPEQSTKSKDCFIWFHVRDLKPLFEIHRKQANIVKEIQSKPWGFDEYVVQEINGYYLVFSAPTTAAPENPKKEGAKDIRIVHRAPTVAEHHRLMRSVGWVKDDDTTGAKELLDSVVFSVVAERIDTGEAIGCALLHGDNQAFYYVKDVMVDPQWQRMNTGHRMMRALTDWFETYAPKRATVGLFTGERLARFYSQYGFIQACGMYRSAKREH